VGVAERAQALARPLPEASARRSSPAIARIGALPIGWPARPEAERVWPVDIAPAFVVRLLQRSRETEPEAGQLRRELDALLAARGQTLEDAIRSDGRSQATEQAFVSSLVGSLRLVATFDWTGIF
jgi:hypothetical protein